MLLLQKGEKGRRDYKYLITSLTHSEAKCVQNGKTGTFNYESLDCSQPSIFSHFYSIGERADKIARELDTSGKREIEIGEFEDLPNCLRKLKFVLGS